MTMEEKIREFKALISLIDEPDQDIFNDISQKIISHGTSIIPYLESEWESTPLAGCQNRIETLIQKIQYNQVCQELINWTNDGGKDLLKGSLIVCRYQYPSVNESEIEYQLGKIRKDIWLEINDNLTALEQIKVFNYIFYDLHRFSGNTKDYHAPGNSYINKVLESRVGNPLSLGIIYITLAQSLNIPVCGINLPEHFVLAYTGNNYSSSKPDYIDRNVLFYINAFNKGMVFSFNDLEIFLKKLNKTPRREFVLPCSNTEIILRMLNNLKHSYIKISESKKAKEIEFLFDIVKTNKSN